MSSSMSTQGANTRSHQTSSAGSSGHRGFHAQMGHPDFIGIGGKQKANRVFTREGSFLTALSSPPTYRPGFWTLDKICSSFSLSFNLSASLFSQAKGPASCRLLYHTSPGFQTRRHTKSPPGLPIGKPSGHKRRSGVQLQDDFAVHGAGRPAALDSSVSMCMARAYLGLTRHTTSPKTRERPL